MDMQHGRHWAKIERDGRSDLEIRGAELLAHASNYEPQGPRQNRWRVVEVWRSGAGRLVGVVQRHSRWQGEGTTCDAEAFVKASALRSWLVDEAGWDLAKEALTEADMGEHATEVVE
jgi:hypothetical protein